MFVKGLPKRKRFWICASLPALLLLVLPVFLSVEVFGHYHGVYLLRQGERRLLLTDDVLLGQEDRLLFGFQWSSVVKHLQLPQAHAGGTAQLDYEWISRDGSGYVRNIYPDGRVLLTCFSRFLDSENSVPHGLFVGGSVPYQEGAGASKKNETGMAFYDGKKWQHIWCNANEGLALAPSGNYYFPSNWEFLGSRVVKSSVDSLVLESRHRVAREGVTLEVERFAVFKAGEPYFVLVSKLRNTGNTPATYFYVYGDEPWIGDYGTSTGNVGWVKGRLFQYEGEVDPTQDGYIGMYDHGNPAAGEGTKYTGLANFIENLGVRPDLIYFSNRIGFFAKESEKVPLNSPNNRVLFMQWGPRVLQPGDSDTYALAIGMADAAPGAQVPVKPQVLFDSRDIAGLLARYGQ